MRVRVELARSSEYPDGSSRHGYEFILPLDEAGRFDQQTYEQAPELCTVHRFWEGDEDTDADLVGEILHTAPDRWVFSYNPGNEDDEPVLRFTDHVFREGEYLSVREPGGAAHTFRIALVEEAPGLAHVRPR